MANIDHPNGFSPVLSPDSPVAQVTAYTTAASQTIAIGDPVRLKGGVVYLYDDEDSGLVGIAASAVTSSASGDTIYVYDDPDQVFVGQTSGTFSLTLLGTKCDIEGTTGICEINEDAHTADHVIMVGYVPDTTIGANSRVYVKMADHQLAGEGAGESFSAQLGGVLADSSEIAAKKSGTTFGLAHVPASQTAVYGLLPFDGAREGDTILGARLAGTASETNALTLDAEIVKIAKADGSATVLTASTGFVQVDASGAFDQDWSLDTPTDVDEDYTYGIRILATTGALDTITVTLAQISVLR